MNALSQLGYWFMPERLVLPVALLMAASGVTLRLVGLRKLGGALLAASLALLILPLLLAPIIEEIIGQTPLWLVAALGVALGCYLIRLVLAVFLGKEGAGTLMAMTVAGSFRLLLVTLTSCAGKLSGPVRALLSAVPFDRLPRPIVIAVAAGLAGLLARLLDLFVIVP